LASIYQRIAEIMGARVTTLTPYLESNSQRR
jgi:hypothetical protein